ncbi:hypothetical protein FQA47_014026 [Oryzias melastigma]|uniref:Uncharacterized protein n=1 Tax=Oryzias melastigma TaxID=30732 RepID=A0A834BTY6_ORYME|nr:hypothetical protein FQA47_014026 [Oryzias melastigma]
MSQICRRSSPAPATCSAFASALAPAPVVPLALQLRFASLPGPLSRRTPATSLERYKDCLGDLLAQSGFMPTLRGAACLLSRNDIVNGNNTSSYRTCPQPQWMNGSQMERRVCAVVISESLEASSGVAARAAAR